MIKGTVNVNEWLNVIDWREKAQLQLHIQLRSYYHEMCSPKKEMQRESTLVLPVYQSFDQAKYIKLNSNFGIIIWLRILVLPFFMQVYFPFKEQNAKF